MESGGSGTPDNRLFYLSMIKRLSHQPQPAWSHYLTIFYYDHVEITLDVNLSPALWELLFIYKICRKCVN